MVLWQLLVLHGTFFQPRGPRQQFLLPLETCIARTLYCWPRLPVRSRRQEHGENSRHDCHLQGSSCTCGNTEMLLPASPRAAALCSHGKHHKRHSQSLTGSCLGLLVRNRLPTYSFRFGVYPSGCWPRLFFLGLSSWLFPQAFPRSFRL